MLKSYTLHNLGVFMRGTLPQYPYGVECGIVNLNTSNQAGSHWICYYRSKNAIIYFDSYGQVTSSEIQRYLNTCSEFDRGIQRNTDIVQAANTPVCRTEITSEWRTDSNDSKSHETLLRIYITLLERYRLNQRRALLYQSIA